MSAAAFSMPLKPFGAKGEKWSPLKAENATTMKKSSTASFVITMTVFERADSRMPAISTPATASTSSADGTFTSPPSPGGSEIDSLRLMPKSESSSSVRYAPQPTATAATETPYSRIRSQPMIQASSSPMVAYA